MLIQNQWSRTTLPSQLTKNSNVTQANKPAQTGYGEKVQGPDQAQQASALKAAQKAYKRGDYADLTPMLGTMPTQKAAYTADTAREASVKGVPTHGFFYQNIDSLAQIASDPSKTLDTSFAEDTLDFFTGGNYSQQDVEKLHGQMSTALKEMSQQLADTGKVDASKLKSRMTIGGTEVSLGELADFQMMGQQLSPVFDSINADSSRFEDMQSVAKMSIARLMGRRYGQSKGELGTMFSSAMDKLYDKGMDKINQLYTDASGNMSNTSLFESAMQTGKDISSMFSQLNTTNKSTMAYDFSQKLSTMRGMLNQQYSLMGMPAASLNANMAAKNVGRFFSAITRML